MDSPEPLVLIVSGPSGCGKSTLVKKLLELPGTMFSISSTTRQPRPTETNGEWYNFVSEDEFRRRVKRGDFLEHARLFDKYRYGTPRHWLEEARARGLDLVLEIDVQGTAQVKRKLPEAIAVFVVPPSFEELEKRLRARGEDSEEEIQRRMVRARQEMRRFTKYDYVVVNDDCERAGQDLQAIALAARCRRSANAHKVRDILDSFGGR